MTRITSREVEVDGQISIELTVDDQVRADLVWNGALPLDGPHPGWTLVPRTGLDSAAVPWPWDADDHRDLAQLADALHDHRHHRATRSEVRVRYWEFRARETSADAAAAWARGRLASLLGPGPALR